MIKMIKLIKRTIRATPPPQAPNSISLITLINLISLISFIILPSLLVVPLLLAWAGSAEREELRYNQVQQKASHNSYQRKEDLMTQLKDFRIRAIEFDIHKKPKAPAGDWWVYHNLKGDATVCDTLSECFAEVVKFHQAEPDHEVVTIFFDVSPLTDKAGLNAMFDKSFPAKSIFKPRDLMAACPSATTLQESVTKPECGWPKLKDLRGKFILVITCGYATFALLPYDRNSDLFFLASDAQTTLQMQLLPDQIFVNMSRANPFAKAAREAGFVSRCYWLNDQNSYEKAMSFGAQILATDDLDPKRYPWTVTAAPDGWPFKTFKP